MAMIPIHPAHPERICWGCDKYCAAEDLRCGNGSIRSPHPCELFGDDWWEWENRQEGGTGALVPAPGGMGADVAAVPGQPA